MKRYVPAVVVQVVLGLALARVGLGRPAPIVVTIAEVGLVLLLFSMGAETDLKSLLSRGREALAVAVLGVVFSAAFGFGAARLLGWNNPAAIVSAGVLCATSIAVSASVLLQCGWISRAEGRIVLAAAVIDDVIGLALLAAVSPAKGAAFSSLPLAAGATVAAGLAVWKANWLATREPRSRVVLVILGSAACAAASWAAHAIGMAPFIGAFIAGAFLDPGLIGGMKPITKAGALLAPVYFVLIGAKIDVGELAEPAVITAALALVGAGLVAKVLSGLGSARGLDRIAIGLAMVPRGEVGLIFAATGLAAGLVGPEVYPPLVGSVLLSTLIGPLLLKGRLARSVLSVENAV